MSEPVWTAKTLAEIEAVWREGAGRPPDRRSLRDDAQRDPRPGPSLRLAKPPPRPPAARLKGEVRG